MEKLISEETQKKIIDLWSTGMSAKNIAAEVKKTRSSIMGFIYRQRVRGIELRRRVERPKKMAKKPPHKILSQYEKSLPFRDKTNLRIHELERTSCRFIVHGEGANAIYCGCRIYTRSYCKEHLIKCYIFTKTGPK